MEWEASWRIAFRKSNGKVRKFKCGMLQHRKISLMYRISSTYWMTHYCEKTQPIPCPTGVLQCSLQVSPLLFSDKEVWAMWLLQLESPPSTTRGIQWVGFLTRPSYWWSKFQELKQYLQDQYNWQESAKLGPETRAHRTGQSKKEYVSCSPCACKSQVLRMQEIQSGIWQTENVK